MRRIGDAQAALVAMRPDGRVVAMVGGNSYKASPFNRATQARRQPGSAFKLFVYLAAMRAGYSPDDMIEDRPITIDGWTPGQQRRRLSRLDHPARGVRCGRAMPPRSGCPSRSGAHNVMRAARELGITSPLPDSPSVALGTSGVSLLELTSAYAAVAGGRYPVRAARPAASRRTTRAAGLLLRARRRRSTGAATGRRCSTCCGRRPTRAPAAARRSASPTFGKTGTTQDNRDALFVGFAGDLVVGVWVGRDDDKSLGEMSGGTAPAPHLAQRSWPARWPSTISRGPRLPYHPPQSRRSLPERKSPLPEEWSDRARRRACGRRLPTALDEDRSAGSAVDLE